MFLGFELSLIFAFLLGLSILIYVVLDGFDLGVGLLFPFASAGERDTMVASIGPFWDANETWLVLAIGILLVAFPIAHGVILTQLYLPVAVMLIGLILRGVAFEYRGKVDSDTWRRRWDLGIAFGSWVPSVLWGVAFANIVAGVPIDANGDFTGTLLTLLNPFGLLGGVVTASLFLLHGLHFVALKTEGEIHERAKAMAGRVAPVTIVAGGAFLVWNQLERGEPWTWIPVVVAAIGLVVSAAAIRAGRDGTAFAASV